MSRFQGNVSFGRKARKHQLLRSARRLFLETLEPRLALATVPAYSSLPGANQTIYLDFDGHTTTGTSWNSSYGASFTNDPYDTDGSPSTFSAAELTAIQDAWLRVSEDFIPFNVNVTTVDPGVEALRKSGTGDTQWGVRVVVTKDSVMSCGCGGIAYIDSFNWSTDTPAFVYTTGGKNIAEAASHEIGHSLGLAHDGSASSPSYYSGHGSGETGWASIMGVGYYQNVTQWDRGEFTGANNGGSTANYSKGPDDLAIITTYNGFGYRVDDVGNTTSTAKALTVTGGTSVSGSGIIERATDVDLFSFTTGSGAISLSVTPFSPGPNLDVKLDLLNSAGTVIATADPTTLAATLTASVPAGQYFLRVDGTGYGSPTSSPPTGYSDYASIGRYTVSGSIVAAQALPTLSIADVSVNEGAGTASFVVTIAGLQSGSASVGYSTANGTAAAGSDYTSATGTLTFVVGGAATQTITVPITNDTVSEATETFLVNLTNAVGAIISDGQATGSIVDNDLASISIRDVTATEGNPRRGAITTKSFSFTVTLSRALTQSVTLSYATADGTATTANNDYRATSGTLTFSPGQTSKTIRVTVNGDGVAEPTETFSVVLSNITGATLADGVGIGTIQNDDTAAAALLAALIPDDSPLPTYDEELIEELLAPQLDAFPEAGDLGALHHDGGLEHDHDGHSHHGDFVMPSDEVLFALAEEWQSLKPKSNSPDAFDDDSQFMSALLNSLQGTKKSFVHGVTPTSLVTAATTKSLRQENLATILSALAGGNKAESTLGAKRMRREISPDLLDILASIRS